MARKRSFTAYLYIGPHILFYVVFIVLSLFGGFFVSLNRWSIYRGREAFVGFKYYLRLFDTGTPQRRLEGLKYLARQREEVIMSLLGDSVDDLVDQIIETGSAEIHPRRIRRVVGAAEKVGLRVEVISVVRLVGRPHRRVSEERATGEEETREEAREETGEDEPRGDRELAPMP